MAQEPTHGDGAGWIVAADGTRRWGRFGAAGLLLRAPDPADPANPLVLLQHRAAWTASGGTWAVPGGARDSHEDVVAAAVRETHEEAGIAERDVHVRGALVTSTMTGLTHGRLPDAGPESDDEATWTYTTVVADTARPLETSSNEESIELRWVPEADVATLDLLPAFRQAWDDELRARPVCLVLDVANVVGSRPDGWWRDRRGATERLLAELSESVPRTLALPGGFGWVRRVVAVVEGQARGAGYDGWFDVRAVRGIGDDAIAELAAATSADDEEAMAVVTADRGLRDRLPAHVAAIGPSSVLGGGGGRSR